MAFKQYIIVICVCQYYVNASTIQVPSSASVVTGGKEYILYTDRQSWNTARKICKDHGAHLLTIDSQEQLDLIQELASGVWSSDLYPMEKLIGYRTGNPMRFITHGKSHGRGYLYLVNDERWRNAWTGLHRESDNFLRYDDDQCSLYDVGSSGTDIFGSISHYDGTFDTDWKCYVIDEILFELALQDCDVDEIFICQKSRESPYVSHDAEPLVIPLPGASASVCMSLCDQQSNCFLAANDSTYCVLLTAPVSDPSVYAKDYATVSRFTGITDSYRGSDDGDETATPCSISTVTTVAPSPAGQLNITELLAEELCPLQETVTIDCSPEYTTVTSTQTTSLTSTTTLTQYITVPETVSNIITVSAACLTPTYTSSEESFVTQSDSCVDGTSIFSTFTTTETLTSTEMYTTCSFPSTVTPSLMASTSVDEVVVSIDVSPSTGDVFQIFSTPSIEASVSGTFADPGSMNTLTPECSCLIQEVSTMSSVALYSNDASTLKQTTICRTYNLTEIDMTSLEAAMSSIVKELTLETKNLSSSIRKKTSANDSRKSATGIGYSAVGAIAIPFIILLLVDSRKMIRDVRYTVLEPKPTTQP